MQQWKKYGLPDANARLMAWLEKESEKGGEAQLSDDVEKVTGRKPMSFDAWVEENKNAWD